MNSSTRTFLLLTLGAVSAGAAMPFLPSAPRVAVGSILVLVAVAGVLLVPQGRLLAALLAIVAVIGLAQVAMVARGSRLSDPVVVGLVVELLVLAAGVAGAFLLRAGLVRRDQVVEDKDQLLASISHQLRTPLTAVVGFAEVLRSGAEHSTPEERRGMLTDLSTQAFELSALIDNLLVASRAELDQLVVVSVPVSLRSQLAQELEVWTPDELVRRRVEIHGESPVVMGDPGRIRQILHNMVANAVRHGGEWIQIRLEEGDGFGAVIVADDGEGVTREVAGTLFEPYRAAIPAVLPGPLGLGLGVARHLAQLMGGDVTYERVDGWTCFRLVLPLAH